MPDSRPLPAVWPRSQEEKLDPLVNYEAEQGLLGQIMTNSRVMDRVREIVEPEHFADPAHARIFEACRKVIDRGQSATPIALKGLFDQDGDLHEVGGARYLVTLTNSVVAMVNAEEYAAQIVDLAQRRVARDGARQFLMEIETFELDRSAPQIIEAGEERLHAALNGKAERRGELVAVSSALRAAVEETQAAVKAGGVSGISSGLADIDRLVGGFRRGQVTVVAAATSMGKTDLAVNLATNAAKAGETVAFFSLEMSADELGARILARPTGIAASRQGRGQVNDDELRWLAKLSIEMQEIPLFIDDTPAPTVDAIGARARRLKRKHGLGLIVVDYLQLIAPGNNRQRRQGNRTEDVTEISRTLKVLAKDLDVPVIALAQLSRAVEARENKRPILADLRESGAIEQDADKVLFLFREEYYLERDEPKQRTGEKIEAFTARQADYRSHLDGCRGVAEVIVAKNRGGPKGVAKAFYDPARSHFGDMSERNQDPPQESMF